MEEILLTGVNCKNYEAGGRASEWVGGPLAGWMDGWVDGWVGGWVDRRVDRWVNGALGGCGWWTNT